MQTAYIVKGHIDSTGTIVLDEPTPLPPGPVLVTIQQIEDAAAPADGYSAAERAELDARIAAIAALVGPPPPDDGRTARDYKAVLYGAENETGNVR